MNVLYFGFVRENFEIIRILNEKYSWRPSSIVTNQEEIKLNKLNYKDTLLINSINIRKLKFDYSNLKKIPIGLDDIENLGIKFTNFMGILEGSNSHVYSHEQRLRYSKEIFDYWNSVILNNKIDLVVFAHLPHTTSCYSLYLISKHILNKKILYFDIELFSNHYSSIGNNLENFQLSYDFTEKEFNDTERNYEVEKYISECKSNTVVYKEDVKRFLSLDSKFDFFKILLNFIKNTFLLNFKESNIPVKKNKKEFIGQNFLNNIDYNFFQLKNIFYSFIFERIYLKLCYSEKTSIKKKILFLSPYQPEANSDYAFNSIFSEMSYIFDILHNNSDEFDIYYKEHPTTFHKSYRTRSHLRRSKMFYKYLKKKYNLKFISHKLNTYEEIDDSFLVVTLASTAGLEAIIRGKPVLLFGNSWWSGCDGIFKIRNLEECAEAINKIKSGYIPDLQKIKKYLRHVIYSCEKINNDKFLMKNEKNLNELQHKKADFFYKKYLYYYENKK